MFCIKWRPKIDQIISLAKYFQSDLSIKNTKVKNSKITKAKSPPPQKDKKQKLSKSCFNLKHFFAVISFQSGNNHSKHLLRFTHVTPFSLISFESYNLLWNVTAARKSMLEGMRWDRHASKLQKGAQAICSGDTLTRLNENRQVRKTEKLG